MASTTEEPSSTKETPTPDSEEEQNSKKDYELLREDYPTFDLSFKVIVIGNSGTSNYILNIIYYHRCGKILSINASDKKKI